MKKLCLILGLFVLLVYTAVHAALITGNTLVSKNIPTTATMIPVPSATVVALATAIAPYGANVNVKVFKTIYSTPSADPLLETMTYVGIVPGSAGITVQRAATPQRIDYNWDYNVWFETGASPTPTFTPTFTHTITKTSTPSFTPTFTMTATPSFTPTFTATPVQTHEQSQNNSITDIQTLFTQLFGFFPTATPNPVAVRTPTAP